MPFWLAVTMLQHGQWLRANGRDREAEGFYDEAGEIFGRLRAAPWLERLRRDAPEMANVASDDGNDTR
jgi:hypothetical protein